ncbi:MAG: CBS domain-containing protein [Chloroflexi bacterium]|nr:CBS domain-containing protein [Chloroflexota bacterium]
MSPRAAWRLESLGFTKVYDYVGGKTDWIAGGLPVEGALAKVPRAIDVVKRDVPTCSPFDRVGDVSDQVEAARDDVCIVTNDEGIVLGRLRRRALAGDRGKAVHEVMESGPTTTRADDELAGLVERLHNADVQSMIITTPEGRLLGVVYREDAERYLGEATA